MLEIFYRVSGGGVGQRGGDGMRIARIEMAGGPRMAVLESETSARLLDAVETTDLARRAPDADSMRALLTDDIVPVGRLLSPASDPRKVVAIGLNYVDHASEVEMKLPSEPLVFAKFPSSIVGPDELIEWSEELTTTVDYEAELAVVIGRPARRVAPERALDHVLGYTCLNDVSARDLQFGDGQWVRGKSLDTFCPIGPWLVTTDEIPDPAALRIRCTIDGEVLQDAPVSDLIFSVPELIARLSHAFTLEPGDVIATGTPPGIGWSRDPKRFLRDGEEVAVEIDGIGRLANRTRVRSSVGVA
jgi:2-keto-4-pentenoate hydratase/2-oxohepta-3-ene-1,7-dioic acid hydratase in catechol pathway